MTEPYRKKLIEVALPLEAINRESAREKSIRHGHPSTLHLWWSRKPLATARAVLFASVVDDPSSRPDEFPTDEAQESERQRLFRIIEELVKWENSNNETVLDAARAEILKSTDGNLPRVLDPFCGGGSIPLEAQRLGLEAHASDLNPVAVLITKALIEIPPNFAGTPPVNPESRAKLGHRTTWRGAQGLAEDVRYYGEWMRDRAFDRIGCLYPKAQLPDGREATVIAWLWVRTLTCPNPACGALMPLASKWTLSTKKGKEWHVEPVVEGRSVRYEVRPGRDALGGTVGRRGARCVVCGGSVPLEHVRASGRAGHIRARLMAIVCEADRQRVYLDPSDEHERIAESARAPDDVAGSDLSTHPQYMGTPRYGLTAHRDLFTARQLIALTTFSDLVSEAREVVLADGGSVEYASAVCTFLALGTSRMADICNAFCLWENTKTQVRHLFTRQAIAMAWDFAEPNVFGRAAGDFSISLRNLSKALEVVPAGPQGVARQYDATVAIEGVVSPMICTDPPYYDNVPYADLSDFFYVWLRRSLKSVYPDLFSTLLAPKSQELIADAFRFDGDRSAARKFFERGMGRFFERARELADPRYPTTIFYAFKQSESGDGFTASTGWETMLGGLVESGFAVVGTWPVRSELANRMRSLDSNVLASSIVLACRPRAGSAPVTTRRSFVSALRAELPLALRRLEHANIPPVDLAQAAIGPGMAVFSRYAKVVEADGSAMTVRTALGLINHALDEILAQQEGEFDPYTRFAISWFREYGFGEGEYGKAETLATARAVSVDGVVRAGILFSHANRVRLLKRQELDPSWDPSSDSRLTVWEAAHHLVHSLERGGETSAAQLLRRLGGYGDTRLTSS